MKLIAYLLTAVLIVSCSENTNNSSENNNETETALEQVNVEVSESSVASEDESQDNSEEVSADGLEMVEQIVSNDEQIPMDEKNAADVSQEKKRPENMVNAPTQKMSASDGKEEVELAPEPTNVPLKPNHDKWDALLKKNVSSSGKVNYSGMKSNATELQAYVTYLESFATRDNWTKNEKLAFWINLYNAATVRLIVQNYPITSITKLSGGKPWDQNIVKIGTKNYTLNDIENKIIRPKFKDARIHFAVNCAAKSCPPIMNRAFTASSLNRQLEKQTSAFINGFENSITADKVEISKIFDWYKVDFEKGDVIAFLNKYSNTPINNNAEVTFKEYNWDLNK